MAAQPEPDIVLYDLACTKHVSFSPVVWRIRLMLNYKNIPYKTIFLEFPDIEPTLKNLGLVPGEASKYTVPAIQHVPTNTYIMDSLPIAQFLESTYPDPPVPLTSDLGREIETKGRGVLGKAIYSSVMPREVRILSPRSQEYFRRTREAALGHRLEDLLDGDREDRVWGGVSDAMGAIGELMRTHKADGPFVLGVRPSYTDFFIAGSLQSVRVIDEGELTYGRVGLRRTVQVHLIPMVHNCLRVSKGAWVQIPLLSYLFAFFESKYDPELDLHGFHFWSSSLVYWSQKPYINMDMSKNKKNMIRVGFEPTPLARPGNYC
ncbi:hypothetical protein ACN42_g11430 [Penicillium freii]|uniref:GST N-terminal domain-containing protein n=1 Tax=Penicillium freii TaxID=48697 RepID=A0A101M895_PENFR|nr:hypothetical protein ACN42_g11430 [Penicillium freii]